MLEKLLMLIIVAISIVLSYILFIGLPVMIYAESKCLEQGYVKAHVTFTLDRYCSNLDGAVTHKVVKQN